MKMNKMRALLLYVILVASAFLAISPKVKAGFAEFRNVDYHCMGDPYCSLSHMFSSLQVSETVMLYDYYDLNPNGHSITFSNTFVPDLGAYQRGSVGTWDNAVASLKVDGTVTLYEHPNYNGKRMTFTSGNLPYDSIGTQWNNNALLTRSADSWDCRTWHWGRDLLDIFHGDSNNYVNWNNDGLVGSKAQDGPGNPWKASNFDQGYETYENEIPNLADLGWNNVAQSVRVDGQVTLYDNINYGQPSITVTSDTDLGPLGWANRASSLRLTRGSRVTLYTNEHYTNPSGGPSRSFVYPSYQPPDLKVSDQLRITLEGVVNNWYTDTWRGAGWTGAKFDVFAVEDRLGGTGNTLMLEMYFLRSGVNLIWSNEEFRHDSPNSYNYLVALDAFPQYAERTVYSGDVSKWKIDVKSFISRACDTFHNLYGARAPDFYKVQIAKISFTLESAWNGDLLYPAINCSLKRLRLCYTESGGGCPYVFTWDGQRYVMDNNLLPTSLKHNGTDVEDYYKLEQPLVPTPVGQSNSLYRLQIREFEHEHSYIDQVKLLAVDHTADCKIAVTPEGEIVTYRRPQQPISCFDNNGTSRLGEVQFMDGNVSDPSTYFYGERGDYLILDFGQIDTENAKLILRDDMKCEYTPECCIEVQILNNSQWQTVSVIAPREYWATEAIDLSPYVTVGQELTVRLYWTLPHRLDYVGLDTTPQDNYELHSTQLVSATHSVEGNVRQKLLENDQLYAELVPGQLIQLTFSMSNSQRQNQKRTFILFTEGHYVEIET